MNIKNTLLAFALALAVPLSHAGSSTNGKTYSNFGYDLTYAIFPTNGTLKVYRNKSDTKPIAAFDNLDFVVMDDDARAAGCVSKSSADGWVKCDIKGKVGWVQRAEFLSGSQMRPVTQWPIRYWLNIASRGIGSEDYFEMEKVVPRSPYLVTQKEFSNIFFKVFFDKEGFAISPKNMKKTGDRVFKIGKGIYLAPADAKREKATWLFLNYFEPSLEAMCPSLSKESCYSAANQASGWPGIQLLHTSPAPELAYSDERQEKEKARWFGHEEVAFARFSDPVKPLFYYVPDDVYMPADGNGATDKLKSKNREKPFCIIDCK